MDIALHEIEGECLDFLDELIPHFLPALLFHVARIDFEDPVPRAACAFDGHNVVARDEREVLPGKEEDVLLPFGRMYVCSDSLSCPGSVTMSRPSMVKRKPAGALKRRNIS